MVVGVTFGRVGGDTDRHLSYNRHQEPSPTKESGMVTVLQYRHGEWVIVTTVPLAYLAAVVEPLMDWVAVPARDAESTLNALNYTEGED